MLKRHTYVIKMANRNVNKKARLPYQELNERKSMNFLGSRTYCRMIRKHCYLNDVSVQIIMTTELKFVIITRHSVQPVRGPLQILLLTH